eukprot:TRINITY_DN7185_c0_g1_i1.p1 TRINITY_DN7185_c0_g1~~TRINITY_DN7185_c0_g1_i1.p1  ORF type:complete len:195 (-),score=41.05 TRINITY_DN7185_c0_g1_i1:189-773(-)
MMAFNPGAAHLEHENHQLRLAADKWRRRAMELEDELQALKTVLQHAASLKPELLHSASVKSKSCPAFGRLLAFSLPTASRHPSSDADLYAWHLLASGMRDLDNPNARKAALWDGVISDQSAQNLPGVDAAGFRTKNYYKSIPAEWIREGKHAFGSQHFRRSRPHCKAQIRGVTQGSHSTKQEEEEEESSSQVVN